MRFETLRQWLAWQEQLHPLSIDLGLERVSEVRRRLPALNQLNFPIISVAGTNGKGSSVAMLSAIYRAAGYNVGCYTTPHLLRYNERITINHQTVSDQMICEAFAAIDQARGEISLSYFEFGTLAAMLIFAGTPLDVVVLEVGLGGRLDAVNCFDADAALITQIALDHEQWLGNNREQIALEKAGILRGAIPAVCSDEAPPLSMLQYAADIACKLKVLNRHYSYEHQAGSNSWCWSSESGAIEDLPLPALTGSHQIRNAAGVIQLLMLMQSRLSVDSAHIRQGLRQVFVSGRYQILERHPLLIVDVAHNPASAKALALQLDQSKTRGRTFAVFSVLADKDLVAMLQVLVPCFDHWFVAELEVERRLDLAGIKQALLAQGVDEKGLTGCDNVAEALKQARTQARNEDRIIVFGSFYTVAEVLSAA